LLPARLSHGQQGAGCQAAIFDPARRCEAPAEGGHAPNAHQDFATIIVSVHRWSLPPVRPIGRNVFAALPIWILAGRADE